MSRWVFTPRLVLQLSLPLLCPALAQAQVPVEIVHTFEIEAAFPLSGLTRTADGTYYGTAFKGGASYDGAIYTLRKQADGTWKSSVLHVFNAATDGSVPAGQLIEGPDGALYGTTMRNGPDSGATGTIYKITPGGTFTTLYTFTPPYPFGNTPQTGLMLASDGNFYGTANGGADGTPGSPGGVIFRMTPAGAVSLVHQFRFEDDGQGSKPTSVPIQGIDGHLYGTTYDGGTAWDGAGGGVIYRLSLSGEYTVLHMFTPATDGAKPFAGLLQASDGVLYGTTTRSPSGGTVFKITPAGAFTVLHAFTFEEPEFPTGTLIEGSDGNLYGTLSGEAEGSGGAVFRMTKSGEVTVIDNFDPPVQPSDLPAKPYTALVEAPDGLLYGTTFLGGHPVGSAIEGSPSVFGAGTAFETTKTGGAIAIKRFDADAGLYPIARLTAASDGNLYGVTYAGGATTDVPGGRGGIFKVSPTGGVTSIYSFGYDDFFNASDHDEGANPTGGLFQASDGNLYGTTRRTIFRFTLGGTLTVLHRFTDFEVGSGIVSSLVQGLDGNLYGTTQRGGARLFGTVFRMTLSGGFAIVHSFGSDSGLPYASLTLGADGALYGTTTSGNFGAIFRVTGAGVTFVHNFTFAEGGAAIGALVRAADGNLYGTTTQSGPFASGTLFRFSPSSGAVAVLHGFSASEGRSYGGLMQSVDGFLYGTTNQDVYRIATDGSGFAIVATVGSGLYSALTRGADGRLYGTNATNASRPNGFVYRLDPAGLSLTRRN
jgi:uncharacterized repeat protein (TIGR03803 family)